MQKRTRARTTPGAKPKRRPNTTPNLPYTEAQRVAAITAALTTNAERPLTRDAIEAARAAAGRDLSPNTLSIWIKQYGDEIRPQLSTPTNQEIIIQTQDAVIAKWAEVRRLSLDQLSNEKKLGQSSARDLAVVAGISDDHINKAVGYGPDINSRIGKMEELCKRLNIDMLGILDRYIQLLEQNIQAQTDKNIKQLESGPKAG